MMMAVRPVLFLIADPAPFGLSVTVVLAGLAVALQAVDRLAVHVVGADFLVALAAIAGDPDQAGGRHLVKAALAALGPEESALPILILAADLASLGVDALVLDGHHDVAGIAVPLDFMEMAGARLALAEGAGRRQPATVARVDRHVALAAPARALLGGAIVLLEHLLDGFRLLLVPAAAAGGEGEDRECRGKMLHGWNPPNV